MPPHSIDRSGAGQYNLCHTDITEEAFMSDRPVVADITQTFYDGLADQYDKFYAEKSTSPVYFTESVSV